MLFIVIKKIYSAHISSGPVQELLLSVQCPGLCHNGFSFDYCSIFRATNFFSKRFTQTVNIFKTHCLSVPNKDIFINMIKLDDDKEFYSGTSFLRFKNYLLLQQSLTMAGQSVYNFTCSITSSKDNKFEFAIRSRASNFGRF